MKLISGLVTIYAVLLLLIGSALLFAPEEFGAAIIQADSNQVLFVQLLGASCIGFGATNWVARHSLLGGIYGRAVVAGNQAFSLVGALVLLGYVSDGLGVGFWLLLAILVYGAGLYGVLLVRGPRLKKSSGPSPSGSV